MRPRASRGTRHARRGAFALAAVGWSLGVSSCGSGARAVEDADRSSIDVAEGNAAGDAADAGHTGAVALAALDQNNTSACGNGAAPCSTAWAETHQVTYPAHGSTPAVTVTVDGFWDNAVAPGASAAGSAYGRVSKVSVTTLLPGYDVPVLVASQNWWGQTGHIDNGETSSDGAQEANQVADQISRGFAGQVVAWDGPGKTEDQAVAHIMASAEASPSDYKFAVRFEENYLSSSALCPRGPTVECLNAGIAYIAQRYSTSKSYLKDPTSGKSILFFFLSDDYELVTKDGVDASGMVFEMLKPHGFPANANVVGEYDWVGPTDDGSRTTTTTGSGPGGPFAGCPDFGFEEAKSFFAAASDNPQPFVISAAYKGFDDSLATWTKHRIIDQRCGLTWLETFNHTGSFGGQSAFDGTLNYLDSKQRVDLVMVDTWDDYEEGTEIETGIDNCMSDFAVTLDGSTLSWSPTWGEDPMNEAVTGSEATVSKYAVYLATQASGGSSDLRWLTDVACENGTCAHSLDLSGAGLRGGPFVFYVQAVGKPSIVNHLAGPTATSFTGK